MGHVPPSKESQLAEFKLPGVFREDFHEVAFLVTAARFKSIGAVEWFQVLDIPG